MEETERRRRVLMIAGLLAGGLMLAVAAILVGGAFSARSLTQVSLPDHGRRGPAAREPGVIESRLTRYRIPVTRPVDTAEPVSTPTRSATPAPEKKTPSPTPSSPRPQVTPSRALSPTPSPVQQTVVAVPESSTARVPPGHATPGKTKKPHHTKRPKPLR